MTEVRSVSSTGGEKGTKDERFDLLPAESVAKIARHFGVGARKYEDHNWRRGYEWSKSYAAMQRHLHAFWAGEDIDEETGSPHLAAAGFHVLALLEFMDRFPEFDDRYKAPVAYDEPDLPEIIHPIGEAFTDALPTVSGFYEDYEGDVWELRSELDDGKGRWTIASDHLLDFVPWEDRTTIWYEAELYQWLPLTRVVEPLPTLEF